VRLIGIDAALTRATAASGPVRAHAPALAPPRSGRLSPRGARAVRAAAARARRLGAKAGEMAAQDILINWAPQETRVAIVENGAVQELHIERTLERGQVGNVYLGKVVRVLPGMQSAFIDVGLERAAFLHVADLHGHGNGRGDAPLPPIERQVFEGQTLTVQVIKDAIGTKGARLSTQISIAGRLLVFLPQDTHIGISQKIGSHELREQLRTRLQALAAAGGEGGDGGGFILRTNAEDATDAELAEDIAYLRKTWARIREAGHSQSPGTLLHQDLSLAERVLRDLANDATQSVKIDSKMQFDALQAFGETFMPRTVGKLELYRGERPIFDLFNIEEEIVRALARRVDLKSGGYLIIDQTEALTTIDVNTGGYVGARNFEDTIFKTNLEAAGAIARQLRLRNLGGIIIVDFIDMAREEHQSAVLAEFRKQLARDRTRTTVSGFTQLGLVEMTRKRTRESLAHMLCEPCPTCQGRGQVKTARSVCYDILREILREARQFNPKEFRVVASAGVVEMLLDEESVHLAGLSEFIGKPISLAAEPTMNPEQYDIVLM
jgi:ribonuclease G